MHRSAALDQLGSLDREPVYNTRAVAELTGVPADTFRAWERRYGVPRPTRATNNQRLYSEFDIGLLGWLRDRTAEGMQISRAAQRLRLGLPAASDAWRAVPLAPPAADLNPTARPHAFALSERLVDDLLRFDEMSAAHDIDAALALYSIEHVCAYVLHPTLTALAERWRRGDIATSQQRFATRAIGRRLSALFDLLAHGAGRGTLVAACAPDDEDEVALLLLGVCLARRDWRVLLLGAGAPTDELTGAVRRLAPDLVCLSVGAGASQHDALAAARELHAGTDVLVAVAVVGDRAPSRLDDAAPQQVHVVYGDPYEQALAIEQLAPGAPLARDALRAYTP
jgi:DNA-binding transcriptional MerR regulator